MNKSIFIAVCVAAFTAGCAAPQTSGSTAASPLSADEPAAETAEPTPVATVGKDDFRVRLKTTEQQCFGSAGCMVTVKPKLAANFDDLPAEGTVDITYRVSGDESGPVIETISLDLSTKRYDASEILMSTTSSSVVPSAKVTDVEYSEF